VFGILSCFLTLIAALRGLARLVRILFTEVGRAALAVGQNVGARVGVIGHRERRGEDGTPPSCLVLSDYRAGLGLSSCILHPSKG